MTGCVLLFIPLPSLCNPLNSCCRENNQKYEPLLCQAVQFVTVLTTIVYDVNIGNLVLPCICDLVNLQNNEYSRSGI